MAMTNLHTISVVGDSPKRRRVVDEGNQRTHGSSLLQMWRTESDIERKIKALKQLRRNMPNDDISDQTCETEGNVISGSFSEGHSDLSACVHDGQQSFPDIGDAEKRNAKQDFGERMTYGAQENYSNAPQLHGRSTVHLLGDNVYQGVRIVQDRRSSPSKKVNAKNNLQTEMGGDALLFNRSGSRPNLLRRKFFRLCGKQTLVDLLLKAEKERESELQDLTKSCPVSKFSHRLRIQLSLKSRFLRNTNLTNEKPKTRHTASRELELLKERQTVSDLREGFVSRRDRFGQSQLDGVSDCMPSSQCLNTTGTKEEITKMTREENIVVKDDSRLLNLQSFENVNSEDDRHASDEGLHVVYEYDDHMDTKINDMNNDHLMDTVDAPSIGTSHIDYAESILGEGNGAYNTREVEATRGSDAFSGSDSLHGSKGNACTSELSEIVGRKRVSNLLQSDFGENLNHLLLKCVERQARASVGWDLVDDVSSPASGFMCLVPEISSQNVHTASTSGPVSHSGGPLSQILGEPLGIRDWEVISDMRMDISTLQLRMNEMQRMLAACMDMQLELQHSIRLEVAAALKGSLSQDSNDLGLAFDNSKWDLVRKGICCVCSHSSIDSLLYRCGHMCACTTCANRLFEEKNKCPMCQSPILEVIRAHCIRQH